MFSRVFTLVLAALPLLAVATNQCNTADQYCCNSHEQSNSTAAATILQRLGVDLGGLIVSVGLGCSPISGVIVGDETACDASPLCCTNNQFDGLINIGCSPISI